jgi:YVTN family beta-propeller protein
VSVIDTATNTVTTTITVGDGPRELAVNSAGTRAYTANRFSNDVSVIDLTTNTLTATVSVGNDPRAVAVNPAGTRAYTVNYASSSVSVIDTVTNTVTTTIGSISGPNGIAVTADGAFAYVASGSSAVKVIDTATNTVTTTIGGLSNPVGVAVNWQFRTSYTFTGFFAPVENLPVVNVMTAGRAVPIKFSLNGDQGLDIFATGYPASQQINCNTGDPLNPIEDTVTAGNSSLSYDPATDTYTYVWKTNKAWNNTCQALILQFEDNSTQTAHFQFT